MQKQKFSPKKYVKANARKLPIEACLIADGFEHNGLTMCLIVRRQPSGKYTIGSFMVDRFCLGVKDCMWNCNFDDIELEQVKDRLKNNGMLEEVTPEYFHNLIYAAIDYADELGFKPSKDFEMAEYVLDDSFITDDIDNIEMGQGGRPLFVQGPFDDVNRVLGILDRTVGPDGYDFIAKDDQFGAY